MPRSVVVFCFRWGHGGVEVGPESGRSTLFDLGIVRGGGARLFRFFRARGVGSGRRMRRVPGCAALSDTGVAELVLDDLEGGVGL